MVATNKVNAMFAEARALHDASLVSLGRADIRDAAEKAWMATKRATDALIVAHFDSEPQAERETSAELERLAGMDPQVDALIGPYCVNLEYLHHACARLGLCDPVESAEQYIRETADYIRDAEELANVAA